MSSAMKDLVFQNFLCSMKSRKLCIIKFQGTSQTYDVEIYGYYIESEELVTLRAKIIEF